jgi:hypothetical protein
VMYRDMSLHVSVLWESFNAEVALEGLFVLLLVPSGIISQE